MEKKEYMKRYNHRDYVKEKKKKYMRKKRAEKEEESSRNLVNIFLDAGFENLAYEYALERAPSMLINAKQYKSREK